MAEGNRIGRGEGICASRAQNIFSLKFEVAQ